MKRFKNILYFIDKATEPETALDRAVLLARQNKASLTIVDVLDHLDSGEEYLPKKPIPLKDVLVKRRHTELDYLIEPYKGRDLALDCRVLEGVPFLEVIKLVQREGFDLLVKSSRPPKGFYSTLLGSNDMHLLRKCPCPVWIEKPANTHPYRSILAAVDPQAKHCELCDRLVMDLAASMAQSEGARLSVVHAWRVYGESTLSSPWLGYTAEELHSMTENTRKHHEAVLNDLLEAYGLSTRDNAVHLVQGEPAESILHIDNQLRSDLIVMGTVGRIGIPGFIIGNTAEEVLQNTRASILAIKPEGFVCPVS